MNFEPTINEFLQQRNDHKITVFSGVNNSGKTLALKLLAGLRAGNSYLIGVNRFQQLERLQSGGLDPFETHAYKRTYSNSLQIQINQDDNFINLEKAIKHLSDSRRDLLFEIAGKLLGSKFQIKNVDPENSFSDKYIDMDGQNLSLSSSGTRLLVTLLAISLNEYFTSIFIDEPELGLSPKLQAILAKYFFNFENQAKYFPHLEQIFIATHSHLFLDRDNISNNFVVYKEGETVSINQIQTISDFHRLQFNMLGNTFESMFFPSAIVIVEGQTDFKYLDKIIRLYFSDKKISVISANSDSRTTHVVNFLIDTLGDLGKSPFRERIFVVLDKVHDLSLKGKLEKMGVLPDNIIIWDNNGIEYVYPEAIKAEIYLCSEDNLSGLIMNGDVLEFNGIRKTKDKLAEEVVQKLTRETILPEELVTKLLKPLKEKLN